MFEGYQAASFRGVAFHCPERDRSGGRRIDAAEIPFADSFTTRDMGLAISTFTMSGFIFGADWRAQADRLEAALDAAGAGRLVHPTRGEMDVHVRSWSAREDEEEGLDFIRFRIECIPARPLQYPRADIDQRARVATDVGRVRPLSIESFEARWKAPAIGRLPEILEGQSIASLNRLSRLMEELSQGAPSPGAAGFLRDVLDFRADAEGLVSAPGDLAGRTFSIMRSFTGLWTQPFRPLTRVLDFGLTFGGAGDLATSLTAGSPPFGAASAAGAAPYTKLQPPAVAADVLGNEAAFGNLVSSAAAIEVAPLALDHPYASQEDAIAARAELVAGVSSLEAAARAARRRNEAIALEDLRVNLWSGMGDLAADLPRLMVREVGVPQSARAFSWRARGDLRAAPDLVSRNRLRHPAHLPAGARLQLLDPEAPANG